MSTEHDSPFPLRKVRLPSVLHTCISCKKVFHVPASNVALGYGKYCSRACLSSSRGQFSPVFLSKFVALVERCPHDQWCLYCCWFWRGRYHPTGYGRVIFQGKEHYAHRIAWELHHGYCLVETHPHHVIRHLCHTRNCVNPSHLTHGTAYQNTHDTIDAGRMPVGESHHKSKLTAENVQDIRLLRAAGWTYKALANRFHVAIMTIVSCCNRKSWKHV